ncbi:MAG TPA: tannase/feruloyl esterase family alpha/beta hydrolase [Vicinamibacterales bacterium]|jgi:feruloyl esterase|nr:tannase/feruloyl esterase family alpha/beta hydrolase [Vicinamibacterales bacterium]
MKSAAILMSAIIVAATMRGEAFAAAGSCDSLKSLRLPDTTITSTENVPAGRFTAPGRGGADSQLYRGLPEFCRVSATLKPTEDSDIKLEIWLPASGWNGKFQAVGNGAWNGTIGYGAMADALRRGYATSSTDTGHVGGSASFALGHPQKLIDFAYRSEHLMAVQAKAIVNAFYGSSPKYSYWNGCSAGGRQALKEAQMFPADFDGIIAGSPGLDWSGRTAQAVRIAQTLQNDDARLTRAQVELLHNAVVQACDAMDGVKDGLIGNPVACKFDPKVLQCKNGAGPDCLTPTQVETARMIYSPIVNAKTKREIAGLAPGSELGWTDQGWTASARATGIDHFRFVIFKDPGWDLLKFNVSTDVPRLEEGDSAAIDARDPNLSPFFDRGGKLLQYHGWSDPQISPLNSTAYYDRVVATLGSASKISESYRLFVAPGMAHCSGGEGPNDFDKIATLEQWVELGKAPDQIVASHSTAGKVDRTRPLCPYPQVAHYKGTGSIDEASNFTCVKK